MISAILLAAGKSTRMNGINKLTKEIKGTPTIKHSIKNILSSSVNELVIVLGYENKIVEKLIDKNPKIKIIFNDNFKNGIASSIKIGLENISDKAEAFFICLADMPMVNHNTYNKMIESRNIKEIIVPNYKGEKGNPVLFSKSMKNEIISIQGDLGAKKIIKSNKNKVLNLETNDQGVTIDFNTQDSFKL